MQKWAKELHNSPEKTYRWPRNTWKDVQHHSSLETCKSKARWGTTLHQPEWPSSKSLQTLSAGEGVEKKEPYYTVGGNVIWCKTVWRFLRKLKIELPFDPTIPLLGIYPEKTTTHKDTCTLIVIAALFAIAKTWKQPKCPSTEEWIKKVWYIYTMEYYSAIKRK